MSSTSARPFQIPRRRFLATPALAPFVARAQSRPPNILFLLGDDHRWDALGSAGNPIVQTPVLDSLARTGVSFGNMFVTTAICVTSRASIFTGLYSRSHGITTFNQRFSDDQFTRTYPDLLRAAGYRTGFVGKYGLDRPPAPSGHFDSWAGFLGQGHYFPKGEPGPHLTDVMTDQAVEFLDSSRPAQPFCLSVSFKAPHVQDDDPRQFLYDPRDESLYADTRIPTPKTMDSRAIEQLPLSVQRSEARRRWAVRFGTPALFQQSVKGYYRLITGIDRAVGRMLQTLEKRGLRDNTIVIYTGDNGFYLGEHGLAGKWFMHEESIRVPLIVHDPRTSAARGRRLSPLALNIDLAPTMLALAGLTPPPSMQGRSLVPLLRGESPSWRSDFFYEHLFQHAWIPKTEGVRTESWKYTQYIEEPDRFEECYDLAADRFEENNLAGSAAHRPRLEQLRARRAAYLAALSAWRPDRPWREP